MFGLFKKKKHQTEALIEKEEHSGSDNGCSRYCCTCSFKSGNADSDAEGC